jgi:tetratricopeptide (TPR) repeat protein
MHASAPWRVFVLAAAEGHDKRLVSVIQHPLARTLLALLLCQGCTHAGVLTRVLSRAPQAKADPPAQRRFVSPSAYEAYLRGSVLYAQGAYTQAARQLDAAATLADDDPAILAELARAQDRGGDRQGAAATLARMEALAPCAEPLWLAHGELHESHGELARAENAYRHGVECAPQAVALRLALAGALRKLGRAAESLEALPPPRAGEPKSLAVARALAGADAAELDFAFDTWLAEGEVDSATLRAGIERALALGAARLAARLLEHVRTELPLALRARVALDAADRRALALLIAEPATRSDALVSAEVALLLGDADRAALEADDALAHAPSDRARLIRARAELVRGNVPAALARAGGLESVEARKALRRDILRAAGLAALAEELGARAR